MRLLAALMLASLIASPAFAQTGNSGNAFGHYAGYKGNCGSNGCIQASARLRVPHVAYDTDGPFSGRGAYVWPGISDIGATGLWQSGFTIDSDGTGAFTYQAWWECFGSVVGNNNVQTAFDAGATLSLNADDIVDIDIRCTNCTAGGSVPATALWNATVADVTKGLTVTKTGYNCQLPSATWNAWWVVEVGATSNVNFGALSWVNILYNSGNPVLTQTAGAGCTMGAFSCALFEFAAGGGNTGATINPSAPNATTDGFKLCWGTGGFTTCSNDPTMSNAVGGRSMGF